MRFAAVTRSREQQPTPRAPAAELIRRLVAGEPPFAKQPPAAARSQELPADLDQRVRLVGEW